MADGPTICVECRHYHKGLQGDYCHSAPPYRPATTDWVTGKAYDPWYRECMWVNTDGKCRYFESITASELACLKAFCRPGPVRFNAGDMVNRND